MPQYLPLDSSDLSREHLSPEFMPEDPFQLHEFHSKATLADLHPEEVFQFNATPCFSHPKDAFDHEDFVPYKLQLDKTGLFAEFYFHFKRSFSALSTENRAYCSVSLEGFRSCYVGSEQDVKSSVVRVENEFESKFRQCVDPELLKDFASWYLTRSCVESKFQDRIGEHLDLMSYPIRLKELTREARYDDIMPLVDFLLAFQHSEGSIWHHVLLVFSDDYQSEKRTQFLNTKAKAWKRVNIPLPRQIQGFVKEIRDEGIDSSDEDFICIAGILLVLVLFVFLMIYYFPI